MKIITPADFFQTFKNTFILCDTSIFIDSFLNPTEFGIFFNNFKDHGTALVSLDVVKMEFLKGAQNLVKYQEKEEFFNQIIDTCLPVTPETILKGYKLIQKYNEGGKGLSIADLFLGATLMKYNRSLFLLTKNTTDFPTNIFNLVSQINVSYTKGLHTYGIYNFNESSD